MSNFDFQELIDEIRNMTPEEYDAYHQEALKMKEAADRIFGKRNEVTIWHDLRKNPSDTPKPYKEVYVKLSIGEYCYAMCGHVECGDLTWWYVPKFTKQVYSNEIIHYDIIAWCDAPKLPKFED